MFGAGQMDDIQIIAKHLSQSLDVKINFKEGVTPNTDGKTIELPTDMNKRVLFELLAILLHETFHIRFTQMSSYASHIMNDIQRDVLNVLEDIRVDTKACKQYPQAVELFGELFKYSIKRYGDRLKDEALPMRVLKHMIVKARGREQYAYDENALKIIDALQLNEFINKAKRAKSTQALIDPAKMLTKLLIGYMREQKIKQKAGLPTSDGYDDKGTQYNKQMTDQKQLVKDTKRQCIDSNVKTNQDWQTYKDKRQTSKSLRRKFKLNQTHSRKYKYEAENTDDPVEQQKLLDKANRAEVRADQASRDKMQADAKTQEAYEVYKNDIKTETQANNDLQKQDAKLGNLDRDGEMGDDSLFGLDVGLDISGFKSLDKNDLKKHNLELELPKTLDDVLREFFVSKREQREQDEDGRRLNTRKLAHLVTDGQGLFTDIHKLEHKTQVAFVVDKSGSMQGTKAPLIVNALSTLLDSLQRIIEAESLPVEIAVYAFNDEVECLKKFDEHMNSGVMFEKYEPYGGTEILHAVNTVSEKFDQQGEDVDKVCIILTDAEVHQRDLTELRNQTKQDMKRLYIGIEARLYYDEAKELFKDYNITRDEEVIEVLSKALIEAVG